MAEEDKIPLIDFCSSVTIIKGDDSKVNSFEDLQKFLSSLQETMNKRFLSDREILNAVLNTVIQEGIFTRCLLKIWMNKIEEIYSINFDFEQLLKEATTVSESVFEDVRKEIIECKDNQDIFDQIRGIFKDKKFNKEE